MVTAGMEGTLTTGSGIGQGEAAPAESQDVTFTFHFRVTTVRGAQWGSQALKADR